MCSVKAVQMWAARTSLCAAVKSAVMQDFIIHQCLSKQSAPRAPCASQITLLPHIYEQDE